MNSRRSLGKYYVDVIGRWNRQITPKLMGRLYICLYIYHENKPNVGQYTLHRMIWVGRVSFFENACIVVNVFVRYSLSEITRRITCLVWHHIDLHFRCWMRGYPNIHHKPTTTWNKTWSIPKKTKTHLFWPWYDLACFPLILDTSFLCSFWVNNQELHHDSPTKNPASLKIHLQVWRKIWVMEVWFRWFIFANP